MPDVCFLGLWSKAVLQTHELEGKMLPKTWAFFWLLTEMLVTKFGFVYF